jgi:NAD(P)H-dependent FMN reductase
MKIAILLGTVRKGRQSHRAAYYVEKALKARGLETDLIDLSKFPLPIFGTGQGPNQHIENIGSRLLNADALILVTPEYHGSFSGVLKNALDHFWGEFQRKPIGVAAASSGRMGGINASIQLQHVILALGAFPMPSRLLFPDIGHAFNGSFEPQDEQIVKRTNKFLDEFLWFSEAIHQKKARSAIA